MELKKGIERAVNIVTEELGKQAIVVGSDFDKIKQIATISACLLYTSPSPRDRTRSRMPSSA